MSFDVPRVLHLTDSETKVHFSNIKVRGSLSYFSMINGSLKKFSLFISFGEI